MKKYYFLISFILVSGLFFLISKKSVPHSYISINNKISFIEQNNINLFTNSRLSVVNISPTIMKYNFWNYQESITGVGSGFVWDKKGHIVTNFHVVNNSHRLLISFFNDKKKYEAKVVGVLKEKDIAVLKLLETPKNLIPLNFADSDKLFVGQYAIAIGSPFGLDHSMTRGIISSLNRKIKSIANVEINGVIQTDASINPGNSGGPLFNSNGEVIGMNTAIISTTKQSAGVGFAVPANIVKRVVPELIKYGKVIRPILGISINTLQEGIEIINIYRGSSAEKAGLRGRYVNQYGQGYYGDIIFQIDEHRIKTYSDIFNTLSKYKVGDEVTIHYLREGRKYKVKLTLQSNKNL